MHAFVTPILVGAGRLDELGTDPELDPVHGELGEASDGRGSEGHPVVALDHVREPVEAEEAIEATARMGLVDPKHSLAVQEEATEAILNGEGVAELPIAGTELALEVHGPDGVGPVHGRGGRPRVGPAASGLPRLDQAGSSEDLVNGIHARDRIELLRDHLPQLAGTPSAMSAELLETSHDLGWGGVGAGFGAMGTITEALEPFSLVALDPLVTRGSADPISPAELADGVKALLGLQNEADSLIHDACTSPRHRDILRERKPLRCEENCKRSAPNVL